MLRLIAATALALTLAACGGSDQPAGQAKAPTSAAAGLNGAGATFPAPLYAQWADAYRQQTGAAVNYQPRQQTGAAVNYQPIGSGGGVKQIKAGTVDFGGTDKPLTAEEQAAAGLVQFPTVLGGVVPVVNLPGVEPGHLRLTGEQLGDIFRGEIKTWRDPRLASANEGAPMPNLPITVVHRSDASGTTFLFSSYLAGKSAAWRQAPGASDALEWPVGIGGKGNDGVAAYVRQTVGSIGYVEYTYARENKMAHARMQARDGAFVSPEPASFAAAAAGADWAAAPGFYLLLVDQPGANAWPITGATFALVHKTRNPAKAAEVVKFFDWTLTNGDASASTLGYVPLPAPLKALVRELWARDLKAAP